MREFYEWNRDGLDTPMISPSDIPPGYQQRWDDWKQKYVLTPYRPDMWTTQRRGIPRAIVE